MGEERSIRRLIASEFVTLDGIMEAPGHEEHPDGKNSWALQHATEDIQRFKIDELFGVDAILLGRVTYQIWAAFWPTASGDVAFTKLMNEIPKYVASRTLTQDDLTWSGSTLLPAEDAIGAIRELRARDGKGLQVMGSASLAAQLVEHDLVDEYRLMIEPVLLGGGKRLFPLDGRARPLELVSTTTAGTGVLICAYRPASR